MTRCITPVLIKQLNVEDSCIFVQMVVGVSAEQRLCFQNALYEFPASLLASKTLKSVSIRGGMFGHGIVASEITFSTLQRLCLSHVSIGENVMEILFRCCLWIEILILDNCYVRLIGLELWRFPKLKKVIIEIEDDWINYVDIVNTNLECFKCNAAIDCHIGPNRFILFCKEKCKPEEVKPVEASRQYKVNLTLSLFEDYMENVAPLVDTLLWIIRPATLTVYYRTYCVVKYLCENLVKKSQDKICGEQIGHPCWLHEIEDFQVESSLDISDIKENLASLPEGQAIANRGDDQAQVCFKIHWCY